MIMKSIINTVRRAGNRAAPAHRSALDRSSGEKKGVKESMKWRLGGREALGGKLLQRPEPETLLSVL